MSKAISKGDRLILVDGSAFIFRAFHALPPLARKSDGLPVGAVAGFCNMIWKMLQEGPTPEEGDEPTHFGVVFDTSSFLQYKEAVCGLVFHLNVKYLLYYLTYFLHYLASFYVVNIEYTFLYQKRG